jgi:membrane protease YdiL (CAAX protease family)
MLDLILFLLPAIAIPWAIWLIFGLKSRAFGLAMMSPGAVAVVLMLTISPLKLGDSPLVRFGPPEYALLAWIVPLVWVAAVAGLGLLLGLARPRQALDPQERREILSRLVFAGSLGVLLGLAWLWPRLPWGEQLPLSFLSWPAAGQTTLLLALFFLAVRLLTQVITGEGPLRQALLQYPRYLVVVLCLGVLLPVLGEELAWRGFLFPRLAASSIHLALLGTWAVWWLFHGPLGFLSPALRDLPRWIPLAGLLTVAGPAFFAGWLLLASGGLWPAVIFHLTWNLLNPALLGSIYSGKEGLLHGRVWLINGEGLVGTAVSLLLVAPASYWLAVRLAG